MKAKDRRSKQRERIAQEKEQHELERSERLHKESEKQEAKRRKRIRREEEYDIIF